MITKYLKNCIILIIITPLAVIYCQINTNYAKIVFNDETYSLPAIDSISMKDIRRIFNSDSRLCVYKKEQYYSGIWFKNKFLIYYLIDCNICDDSHFALVILDTMASIIYTHYPSHKWHEMSRAFIRKDTLYFCYNESTDEKYIASGCTMIDLSSGKIIERITYRNELLRWEYFYNNQFIIETEPIKKSYNFLSWIIPRERKYLTTYSQRSKYFFYDTKGKLIKQEEYGQGEERVLSNEEEKARGIGKYEGTYIIIE